MSHTSVRGALPSGGRLRPIAHVVVMAIGVVLVFVVALLWGLHSHGQVDPRDLLRSEATPVDATWFTAVGLMAVGLVAAAGLPSVRHTDAAVSSAVGQGAAAVSAGAGTWTGTSLGNIWIYGPQDRCVYANCWPADLQAAAAAIPGVLTATALFVMAVLVRKLPWRTRALVPAAAWLVSVVALRALWEPLLLPAFQAPPP